MDEQPENPSRTFFFEKVGMARDARKARFETEGLGKYSDLPPPNFGITDLVSCLHTITSEEEATRFYEGFINFMALTLSPAWKPKEGITAGTAAALALVPFLGTDLGMAATQVEMWRRVINAHEVSFNVGPPVEQGDLRDFLPKSEA